MNEYVYITLENCIEFLYVEKIITYEEKKELMRRINGVFKGNILTIGEIILKQEDNSYEGN